MSKLSEFLEKQKIDPRRLLTVSKRVEALHPEDRSIRLARKVNRAGAANDAQKALAEQKPRSGRPVTPPTLNRALEGKDIPSMAKTRIVRAVNQVLTHKKKDAVTLRELF